MRSRPLELSLSALVCFACACGDDGSDGSGASGPGSGEGAGGCFVTFDGVDDGLIADAAGLDWQDDFSLSVFVRPAPLEDGAIAFVAGLHKDGDSNGYYLALANEGGAHIVRLVMFTGAGTCSPTAALPSDEWVHVLGSYSGGTARLFVQGELAAELACDPPHIDPSARFTIGRSESNLFPYRGDLDEVAYYAKATTEAFAAAELGCDGATFRVDFEGVTQTAPDACGSATGATLGLTIDPDDTDPVVTCP